MSDLQKPEPGDSVDFDVVEKETERIERACFDAAWDILAPMRNEGEREQESWRYKLKMLTLVCIKKAIEIIDHELCEIVGGDDATKLVCEDANAACVEQHFHEEDAVLEIVFSAVDASLNDIEKHLVAGPRTKMGADLYAVCNSVAAYKAAGWMAFKMIDNSAK